MSETGIYKTKRYNKGLKAIDLELIALYIPNSEHMNFLK
jgi:hypothetical protein